MGILSRDFPEKELSAGQEKVLVVGREGQDWVVLVSGPFENTSRLVLSGWSTRKKSRGTG